MTLTLVTPPVLEPITLAEAKAHLRLDSDNLEPSPNAPSVVLAGVGAGNVDVGAHRYRCTFVTADGETDGGDISAAVTVVNGAGNGQVEVSAIPLGSSLVTARKLYRTKANGDTYFLVDEIADNMSTTYVDNIADAGLGAGIPTVNTTGDPLLLDLIVTAREYAEKFTHRALLRQQWRLTLDEFPGLTTRQIISVMPVPPEFDRILLPRPNLLTVDSVTYVDLNGVVQTLVAGTDYLVDTDSLPGFIYLPYLKSWPDCQKVRNAVTITFWAGYGATIADVPRRVKLAMKLLIAHWYENREAFVDSRYALDIPFSVNTLLWSERYMEM